MTDAMILDRVQKVMADLFDLDRSAVKPEARLAEDLDLTSLDAIDLVVELQHLTGAKVSDDALAKVRTVGDVVALVHAQVAGRA
jgi:acyl carrier protein